MKLIKNKKRKTSLKKKISERKKISEGKKIFFYINFYDKKII